MSKIQDVIGIESNQFNSIQSFCNKKQKKKKITSLIAWQQVRFAHKKYFELFFPSRGALSACGKKERQRRKRVSLFFYSFFP